MIRCVRSPWSVLPLSLKKATYPYLPYQGVLEGLVMTHKYQLDSWLSMKQVAVLHRLGSSSAVEMGASGNILDIGSQTQAVKDENKIHPLENMKLVEFSKTERKNKYTHHGNDLEGSNVNICLSQWEHCAPKFEKEKEN